jgi:hypothetical protein
MLKPGMGGFDSVSTTQKLLGDEGYQKWLKTNSEIIQTTRTMIMRFVPEISNAAPEVAAAAPDFWTPKPAVAAKKSGKKAAAEAKGQ